MLRCTILEQVAYYHSPILAEAIVKTLNPTELAIMNGDKLMCYNIFKAPQPLIKQWCEYCGTKLKLLSDVLQCPINEESVHKFVKTKSNEFLKPYKGKNVDLVYQSRFFGYALERYSHCFWSLYQGPKDFKQVKFLEPGQTI